MRKWIPIIVAMTVSVSGLSLGCREEVAHTEKDRPNLTGGRTHEETTTYRNPDGSYTTEKEKSKTP